MALIGYARVSTNDQHPESQLDQLNAAGCEKVFVDHGVSGKLARRPQFDACLAYLRPGDTLAVTKLDRAGRSVKHLIAVAEQLKAKGIGLKVLLQGIDTTTSAGRLFFNIMASIAEFEGDIISERTVDGLTAARARGRVGGRKPVLSERQLAQVRRMAADGEAITDIAATFKVSRPTIYKALEQAPA
jgi:DNA invertase Pin-like site-specific DNA recombinase